jgi:hypothetical protein
MTRSIAAAGLALALALTGPAVAQNPSAAMHASCMDAPSTQNFAADTRSGACDCMVDIMMSSDVPTDMIDEVIDDFDGSVVAFREDHPELLEQIRNECAPS